MLTAIKSLFFIILAIFALVLSFFIGLILLVRGLLKKPLAEYAGSQYPKQLIITGVVLISLPLIAITGLSSWSITASAATLYARANYECVPDIWRNESVSQSKAEDDILNALLGSADKGNRKAFSMNFTPALQKKKGFGKAVDSFFEAYPLGLSRCDRIDKTRPGSEAIADEAAFKTDSLSFRCSLEGNWYFVVVEYCYLNKDHPDKVGVTNFRVMNLEAAAVYFENEDQWSDAPAQFPVCDIRSSDEINARMVGGRPYLWTLTDTPRISEDQLRHLLKKTNRLDDPILSLNIGEPNLIIKQNDSSEYGYFFELNARDGEPCYAYLQTDSERGKILWVLLCTPYEVDQKHPLYMDENVR